MRSSIAFLKRRYSDVLTFARDYSPSGRDVAHKRQLLEANLDAMARSAPAQFKGTVLVDGTFDNPNFWFRYGLLRTALGLAAGQEIGAIGPYRRRHVRSAFSRMGISRVLDLAAQPNDADAAVRQADALLASSTTADDVLNWQLPGDVAPAIVYDAILKRQRLAALDLQHPDMRSQTRDALKSIVRAQAVLDEAKPDLVVVSHTIGMTCGSLAYLAAARGIPVILAFGLFGALRFARFGTAQDIFSFYDRPTRAEIDGLPSAQAEAMAEIGRSYLKQRFDGKADDLASVFAFKKRQGIVDRRDLCALNGWDPNKPIVAFYASNWFDWPHQLGMTQFRDFLDWTEATFAVARDNPQFNWLFKPHPAEEWFGGVALSEIVNRLGAAPHIAIADATWNNTEVMKAIDALVTYHGTAGIEFAAMGKPVIVPDRGKYDDCGFVRVASSREDYLSSLATRWWDGIDLEDARRRAEIFAGWWFCSPKWQGGFVLADDSRQDALYDVIPKLLAENVSEVAREIETLRHWWNSSHRYYHTWKMAQTNAYQLSNV